jgi:DNA-binding beta-propeller fold protein YncE
VRARPSWHRTRHVAGLRPIALTADDARIVIASEDHDELLIVDRARHEVRSRVAVGDAPTHLIISGSRAIVTARYGHSVTVVDLDRAAVVRTIPVGAEPMGLVEVEAGVVAVALAGAGAVAVLDIEAGRVLQTIALGADDPRAVALLADGSLYVSHMAQGVFSRVDLDAGSARVVDVATANQFGARLIPEHLRSLTIDPAYDTVLVAHSQANADTVRAPIGDPGFEDPGIVDGGCGYSGCPTELGAVVPGVTEVDPEGDVVIVPQHDTSSSGQPGCPECDVAALPVEPGFGTFAAAPPSVMNPFESRFAGVQLSNPTALALFDGGRGQLVVHMSTKNALLLRRHLKGTASDVIGVAPLGNGAAGVAVSHDGTTAFVWNQFDGAITEIALPQVADRQSATRFNDSTIADRAVDAEVAEFGLAPQVDSTSFVVADDVLDAAASLGRKMFHDATDVRISANGTVSCASCHPDGRTDGRTWQFTFGPRNTPQLGGDILDTAPFHWPGDVPTVAALNDMTVKPFMGGAGMTAADFEPITAFLGTIRQAPSVAVARGALSELEQRGKAVFESQATGCTSCHAGGDFTDNASHDIGSTADFRDIRAFQTPVLHGLHRSAPYFHDGKYKTLEDMVAGTVLTDQMGTGSHLSDDDTAALVAYLKTLGADTGSSTTTSARGALVVVLGYAVGGTSRPEWPQRRGRPADNDDGVRFRPTASARRSALAARPWR